MTTTFEDGTFARYNFTVDFVEPNLDEYPIEELAEEVDGDTNLVKNNLLDTHTDAIQRASARIETLLSSDEELALILSAHGIQLRMGLSH